MRLTPRNHRSAAIAIVALLAVGAAGCGSQSHGPSKLAAAADPICRSIAEKRAEANAVIAKASSQASALEALARLAPEVATYERHEADLLAALRMTGSQTHNWQTMLAGIRQLTEDTKRIGVEAKAKDIEAVKTIDAGESRLRSRLATIGAQEGFVYCGHAA